MPRTMPSAPAQNPAAGRLLPFMAAAAGIALFCVMDALVKSASIQIGVYSALLFRSLAGTALLLPLWLLQVGKLPSRAALRIHALRAAVVAAMAVFFFWGLVRMPMAEAIALSFIAPLVALYLAALLLGERIRRTAVVASLFGIAGVVVIAAGRLGSEAGEAQSASALGIASVLASALLYAWNLVIQRQQALLAPPVEVAFFQAMFMGIILAVAAPWLLRWPTADVLIETTAAAALAGTALVLLTWAYARAEAQALVPFEYTALIWAALLGWLWFGDPLTPSTLAGAALVIAGSWLAAARTGQPAQQASSAS
jgi:S-adenosylmethionine uptake transporter